jgi:hypothetical protein
LLIVGIIVGGVVLCCAMILCMIGALVAAKRRRQNEANNKIGSTDSPHGTYMFSFTTALSLLLLLYVSASFAPPSNYTAIGDVMDAVASEYSGAEFASAVDGARGDDESLYGVMPVSSSSRANKPAGVGTDYGILTPVSSEYTNLRESNDSTPSSKLDDDGYQAVPANPSSIVSQYVTVPKNV